MGFMIKKIAIAGLALLGKATDIMGQTPDAPVSAKSVHEFTVSAITGEAAPLSAYAGKVMLIVNVASKCGYTPQYTGLEKLYQDYASRGLVVLGFPANDFMGQEPGNNEQIRSFCETNYKISFPMFSKISVKGKETSPLYQYLAAETGEKPSWNFFKYLVDAQGKPVKSFSSAVKPDDPELISAIEALLSKGGK